MMRSRVWLCPLDGLLSKVKIKNGLEHNVDAGLKPLAQYMEALRAGERVELIRLS
jgi:hypothetical protein